MTTYTGRKREPNTLVFGNQMVVDQGVNAMLELTKQMLTGTWKPVANDPATEKKGVRGVCLLVSVIQQHGRWPASQRLSVAASRARPKVVADLPCGLFLCSTTGHDKHTGRIRMN